jgi:hypothetical protein
VPIIGGGGGGGGTPFNGGTIGALKIDNTGHPTVVALDVEPDAAQTNTTFQVGGLASSLFAVDNEGAVSLSANADLGEQMLSVNFWNTQSADTLAVNQNFSPFGVMFRVNKGGYLGIQTHSAPADGDVATGEAMLWFDQTNGASKLMVKGKSANGTVVAAAIALS